MSNESTDLIRQKLRDLKTSITQVRSDIMHEEDEISDIASRIRMLTTERDLLEKQVENKSSLLAEFETRWDKLQIELSRNSDNVTHLAQEDTTAVDINLRDQIRMEIHANFDGMKTELENYLAAQLQQFLSQCPDDGEVSTACLLSAEETAEEIAGHQGAADDPENGDPDKLF